MSKKTVGPFSSKKSMKVGAASFATYVGVIINISQKKRRPGFKVNLGRKKKTPHSRGQLWGQFSKIYEKNFVSCLRTEGVLNTHPAATLNQSE